MDNWKTTLKIYLEQDHSLTEISIFLNALKESGVNKDAVRDYLSTLRIADNATKEDNVLEVLDIVEGFCNEKYRVWS